MKTLAKHSILLALTCIAGLSLTAHAGKDYKPAGFAFSGNELLQNANVASAFSQTPTSVVLYCNAEIDEAGHANRVDCYDHKGMGDIETQTQKALLNLPFDVAEVNDTKVPVRMSFRVIYSGSSDALEATLIPNLGSMQAQYGQDYIAPQERLDISDWYNTYTDNSWVNGDEFFGDGTLSRVAANIGKSGKPMGVRTVEAERAYTKDAKLIESSLRRSRFIPGFVGDRPSAMGYMAVVNYGEAKEQVSYRTDR